MAKNKEHSRVDEAVKQNYSPKTDPNGSYTGKTKNKKEKPVQDADDL